MTAPTYDTLTVDDTGADKILTTGTMQAVDQNPVSIAQRGTNAPLVQPPVREYKTSGTSATWTIPTGVTAFYAHGVGGGGGGGSGASTGGSGGNTTITYNSVTYTAGGGQGGRAGFSSAGGAVNFDDNIAGQSGAFAISGVGGCSGYGGKGYGGGGNGSTASGGGGGAQSGGGAGGGYGRVRITVVAGQTTVTYTVGGGGSTPGADGQAGTAGVVIFEY